VAVPKQPIMTTGRSFDATRRSFIFASLLSALSACFFGEAKASPSARSAVRHVKLWGCQYQNVDLDEVAASDLDMIVVDPSLNDSAGIFVTREDCERLKKKPDGSRRIVLAYLCVGEADIKRWYWPEAWMTEAPSWVGAENPNWNGAHAVQYWHPEWQSLVYKARDSILATILDAGFDGVVLDRVDAYTDWEPGRDRARNEMIDLVVSLATTARKRNPDFVVIAQNAEPLLTSMTFVAALDGHNKESLLTGLKGPDSINTTEDVDWSLNYLRGLQNAGVATLATEYISDTSLIPAVKTRLLELGFVPFFGVRALDILPRSPVEG